jgi:hypothetical protein
MLLVARGVASAAVVPAPGLVDARVLAVAAGGGRRPDRRRFGSRLGVIVVRVGVEVGREQHEAAIEREGMHLDVEAGADKLLLLHRLSDLPRLRASAFVAVRLTLVREGGADAGPGPSLFA